MFVQQPQRDYRFAFVTLLYGDSNDLGARVLGRSIDKHAFSSSLSSPPEKAILVTPDVHPDTVASLESDGWMIHKVESVPNPNLRYTSRLSGVFTKLLLHEEFLEIYDRVVFLDADTLLLANIDELFRCGPFCAVMRHSELLNSGVMVIEPSKEVYLDMTSKDLYSYTGGDQGRFQV